MKQEMRATLRDVHRSARLWPIWVRLGFQDVRLRFRRSAVGPSWIFLNLGVLVLSIGFIYANLLGQSPDEFIPYLTMGLIAWGYLTNSIVDGGNAFIHSEGYVRQISLPIYVYIFRSFVSIGLTSLITLCAFAVVVLVYPVPLTLETLLVVPGLVVLMITSLLLITIFAHLNARFRDIAHLAAVGMQVLFYVTPVLFPAELLLRRSDLRYVVELNPAFHLLELVRRPLVAGQAPEYQSYVAGVLIIAVLGLGALSVLARYGRRIVFSI